MRKLIQTLKAYYILIFSSACVHVLRYFLTEFTLECTHLNNFYNETFDFKPCNVDLFSSPSRSILDTWKYKVTRVPLR